MTGIRRALAPALFAAAVLACAFAIERSLACPISSPPQPLRMLYQLNDRVLVARVGAKEVLQTEENVASVRTTLHVIENLKGTPVRSVHLYHDEPAGGDAVQGEDEVVLVSLSSGRPVPRLKPGERFLFFLNPREEGGGYEVNDEGYGIKQLSDDDLKVYLERIKELDGLTRREPEDKVAVVEWLVRCAEQPATRWEGAYELLLSAEAAALAGGAAAEEGQAEAEQGSSAPADPGAAPAPAAERRIEQLPRPMYSSADPALVPLLNAVQKQRLSDALVASTEPSEGDDTLMQVVKDFGDPRLPGFLLARLHRFEDEAPAEAGVWLSTLAASLKHQEFVKLAASYAEDATYYEHDEQPEAEAPAGAAAEGVAAAGEEAAGETEGEEPEVTEAELASYQAAAERATRKRSAALREILARIDLFVAAGPPAARAQAEARP